MLNCTLKQEPAITDTLNSTSCFFLFIIISTIIPWMILGLYTCIRNLNICSNSFCKMNTEINQKDVHKVYIESKKRNSR